MRGNGSSTRRIWLLTVAATLGTSFAKAKSFAQEKSPSGQPKSEKNASGEKSSEKSFLGESSTSRWKFGLEVKATSGAVTGILATLPVPKDWPEQTVKQIEETKSPQLKKVSYRELDGLVKQMIVSIPRLETGETATIVVTYEITKRDHVTPEDTTAFRIPPKLPNGLAKFLQPSPFIESRDPRIAKLAGEAMGGKSTDWEKSEAIFDFVRDRVKYEFAEAIKPAVQSLVDGKGDCEEMSGLFVAFCRANKIPARTIWIPGHAYPEFYLEDAQGHGHWFPCQVAGDGHHFGDLQESKPILQKGDNFKVPEESGQQRYVKQFLKAKNAEANPEVRFIMQEDK